MAPGLWTACGERGQVRLMTAISEMDGLWESTLENLRGRLARETFETWLQPIRWGGMTGKVVRLRIPNRFYAEWIASRLLPEIVGSLAQGLGTDGVTIEWVVDPTLQADIAPASTPPPPSAPARVPTLERRPRASARPAARVARELPLESAPRGGAPSEWRGEAGVGADDAYALNPRYSFDSFVVGPSNQLAYAASVAASQSPGKRYNPLFIYSKVGLGKTHLVNAVGHTVRADRPDARVLFLSAERFTNEFIWALQHKRIDEFRARYRSHCDVLVIDDIQFLAGREQTQEEFFHTFNALYHLDKQIVVTSDVYPQQIREMEERLVSRFQWGLVADIQPPELDTRIAILRKKAEQERITLADDVALVIAQKVQSNVRELEGTLLRLTVLADSQGRALDLDVARDALGGHAADARAERQVSVEDVQRAACEYFGVTMKELVGDRRHRNVSLARMVAMYVCRARLGQSYPSLGMRFGNKDHTTVMNAYNKIKALGEHDDDVRRAIDAIERRLG